MMSVWKMEWVDITFFFSRERRFVSSYFLLASLNNSLPLFYFILLMLSLFFFLVQPSIYKQNKFVIFNRLVSSKLGDQVNPIIIWSLNFFLFTFVPFVQFNFSYFIIFWFFEKKININVDLISALTTEWVESRFFLF
jgi:hypothetical protein